MPAGDTRQGERIDFSEITGVGLPSGALREPVRAAIGRAAGDALGPKLARAAGAVGHPSSGFDEAVVATGMLEAAERAEGQVHSLTKPVNGDPHEASLWGMAAAWLRSSAAELAAGLGPTQFERTSLALSEISEGWMLEARDLYDAGRTVDRYMAAVNGARGGLGALAASLGGCQAGLEQELIRPIATAARGLAIGARVRDDLIDLMPSEDTERPAGHGLAQGVYTLPAILSIERDPGLASSLGGAIAPANLASVVERIRAAASPVEASARCRELIDDALSPVAEIDGAEALVAIGAQIVDDCDSAVTQ
jgi:Polyprenyl synthetase